MSEWTVEKKVAALTRLPWTILPERDEDEGVLVLRVAELPGVIGVGEDAKSVTGDFWDAFKLALEAMVVDGDAIPLPPGVRRYPWQQRFPNTGRVNVVQVELSDPRHPLVHEETGSAQQLVRL